MTVPKRHFTNGGQEHNAALHCRGTSTKQRKKKKSHQTFMETSGGKNKMEPSDFLVGRQFYRK